MEKSISLVMYGIRKCSGMCLYCSAASTMDYRDSKNKSTFKLDKQKTKERILEYTNVLELSKKEPITLRVDLWGGNPVENFDEFKETVKFLQNDLKEFNYISIHTSGNGLELQSDDIVDFLIGNNIHYQLSHDGLGQYLRTGEIDPLYWEKTAPNIVKLAKLGIFDWINCTLNNRNYSFFENKKYFDEWIRKNNLYNSEGFKRFQIKLNHLYPGTPQVDKKWLGKDIPALPGRSACKHGECIGSLSLTGGNLINYMHELRKIGLICSTPNIENNPEWAPYVQYIRDQISRWRPISSEHETGACRQFQIGISDKNFAIDTVGEYCQCNLIDSSSTVKNPSGKRTAQCKDCIYSNQNECHMCGSEFYEEKCHYLYQYCQVLEEFAQLRFLIEEHTKFNNLRNTNTNNKPEPVYCVKNYNP